MVPNGRAGSPAGTGQSPSSQRIRQDGDGSSLQDHLHGSRGRRDTEELPARLFRRSSAARCGMLLGKGVTIPVLPLGLVRADWGGDTTLGTSQQQQLLGFAGARRGPGKRSLHRDTRRRCLWLGMLHTGREQRGGDLDHAGAALALFQSNTPLLLPCSLLAAMGP